MILSSRMKRKMVSLCLALGMTAVSLPLWQMPLKAEASETALEMGDFQAAEAEVTLEDVRQKADVCVCVCVCVCARARACMCVCFHKPTNTARSLSVV